MSHAYLFFGGNEGDRNPKFDFAWSLANFLENGKFEKPIGPLAELLIINKSEEGAIGIDAMRSLKHFLYQKPIFSRCRTVIIRDAEEMTQEAQNAVLKIVEEPPVQSLIIFIARNENNLFPTLFSRLQKIYFPPVKSRDAKNDWRKFSIEDLALKNNLDDFFESLLGDLEKDPIKNSKKSREVLKRLTLINQFNTNKKLQLKALWSYLGSF